MSSEPVPTTEQYTALYAKLEEELQGLDSEQLVWKPSPDSWSIAEVLGHLVDASIVHYYRARKIAAEPSSEDWPLYAQDHWVAAARANDIPAEESVAAFRKLADYNALFFRHLSEDDWARSKRTDKGEEVTLRQHFNNFISHTHNHLRQIGRIKQALDAISQERPM